MNKKHLIQFVATVGAVLVLYVFSADSFLHTSYCMRYDPAGVAAKVYEPVLRWNEEYSAFRYLYGPYSDWWFHVFNPTFTF